MYQVKHGAVIGWKTPITWIFRLGPHESVTFPANHSAVFDLVHQTSKFCQTTV